MLQIYRSLMDGSRQRCLSCATVPGPSGLPQERPQGDWIMFESFGAQPVHLGSPGLGGVGGDIYVMRPDGTRAHRLTTTSDPDHGARYTAASGTPYDNFHAYFSPDGRHVVWTHTEANPLSRGGEAWEMLLGDFVVRSGVPQLRNVRVVGRPYGAYETQPFSPDGRGFLFFASGGYRSPYQAAPPGWGNGRVLYMRLFGPGASPAHPQVTLIGDNEPVYEEQAVFTPDMRAVIMMSNRGASLGSWYDAVAAAAQRSRFDAPDTGASQTLQFLADFSGADFSSDLFAVDGATGAIRRLTRLGQVIPEFAWNSDGTRLLWSFGGSTRTPTFVARFTGLGARARRVPARTPAWLAGSPVRMSRVARQASPVRDPGPTDDASPPVRPPNLPPAPFPHAASRRDPTTVPTVLASYLGVWQADLAELGRRSGTAFGTDAVGRLLAVAGHPVSGSG